MLGKLHQISPDLLRKKYPKYHEDYAIQEGGGKEYILVITPTKIVNWDLYVGDTATMVLVSS